MNDEKIGTCGDNCSYCLRYLATSSQNKEELKRIKDLWVSFGWRDSTVDWRELQCFGCQKETRCAYEELRNCAFEKGLRNCGMCKKYPCQLNIGAFERTDALFDTCKFKCSKKDQIALEKSFKNKKINLDKVHNEMKMIGSLN